MALHTQRRYACLLSVRLSCLRVFAPLTTRCVLRGVPLACVDLGSHNNLLLPNLTFGLSVRFAIDLLFYNLFFETSLLHIFLFQTEPIRCLTSTHLIIRLHRCLASGGWAGLSTTRCSFCSWPTPLRAVEPCWHLQWHLHHFSRRLFQSGPI